MKRRFTLAVTALALGIVSQAHAATLYTAGASSNDNMFCTVVNTKVSGSVTVSISAYTSTGALIEDMVGIALAPGQGTSMSAASGDYCRFEVVGSKRNVAAMAIFADDFDRFTAAIPAY